MIKRSDYTVWYLIGAALAIKLGYLFFGLENATSPGALSIDALYHYKWASLIASGDLYTNAPYFRAPFYPYFLALLLKVSGHSLIFVRFIQILLGCLTLYFIYRMAEDTFGKPAAILASVLFLFYPITTYFESELLLDSLFTLLALAALYYYKSGSGNRNRILISGLFFGLAALTRPTILIFLPIVLYYLYRRDTKQRTLEKNPRSALWFIITALLIIAPVSIINYIHSGRPIPISYQGGVNFYIGNNTEADGFTAGLPPIGEDWDIKDADYLAYQGSGEKLLYDRQSRYWYGQGIDFILSNPIEFLKLTGKKIHFLFSGHEISNNRPLEEVVFQNSYLKWMPVRASIIISLAILPLIMVRNDRRKFFYLYGIIALYGLVVSLFFVTSRFRLPLMPLLAILAGGGITAFYAALRTRQFEPRFFVALLAAGAIFLLGQTNPYNLSLTNSRQALFLRANSVLRQADYTKAVTLFDNLSGMTPYHDNSCLNLGIAYLKQGKTDSAQISFLRELSNNPGSAEAANNLGVLYLLKKEYDSAAWYCERALEVKPYYEEAAINLLRCGRGSADGDLRDKVETIRRQCRRYLTDNPSYLFEEGLYLSTMKRYSEAIDNQLRLLEVLRETRTTVSFSPTYSGQSILDRNSLPALANYQLGYLYGLTDNISNSIRFSRRAIELNNNLKEAYINLISGYRSNGDVMAADSLVRLFLSRWPDGI